MDLNAYIRTGDGKQKFDNLNTKDMVQCDNSQWLKPRLGSDRVWAKPINLKEGGIPQY